MRSLADRRFLLAAVVFSMVVAACTSSPPPTSAPASPVAAGSPAPAALASSTPQPPPVPVGGGAAQPRVQATFQPIGGSAAIIVPTPNFASNPTSVPAAFAPAVSLTTPGAANLPAVTGTLSRIPTALPAVQQSQLGIIATATAVAGGGGIAGVVINVQAAVQNAAAAGGGGGGAGQNVPAVQTATPPVRAIPATQPPITFPGR